MFNMNRLLPVLLASAVGVTTGVFATLTLADQPRMHAAVEHLEAAERELQAADNDKGGHRNKALSLTRKAIAEARKGVRFDRRN